MLKLSLFSIDHAIIRQVKRQAEQDARDAESDDEDDDEDDDEPRGTQSSRAVKLDDMSEVKNLRTKVARIKGERQSRSMSSMPHRSAAESAEPEDMDKDE